MRFYEILKETTVTSASSIASVPNPIQNQISKKSKKRRSTGNMPKSVNALDSNTNLFGTEVLKR